MIHDGGSEYADLIANITNATHDRTEITSTRNQMFVKFIKSSNVSQKSVFRASIEKYGINLFVL